MPMDEIVRLKMDLRDIYDQATRYRRATDEEEYLKHDLDCIAARVTEARERVARIEAIAQEDALWPNS